MMLIPEPSAAIVVALWSHLCAHYGTRVVKKSDSALMKLAGEALDALDIQDSETFMGRFTTTIGDTIYTNFTLGDPGNLWAQVELAVHEHQHVVQGRRDGLEYPIAYVASRASRAAYEAEAWGAQLEVSLWHFGPNLNLSGAAKHMSAKLASYGCGPEEIEQAQQTLELRIGMLRHGVAEAEAAKVAIEWLNKNAAHLKGI